MGSMVLLTVKTAERLGLDYDSTIVDDGSAEHTRDRRWTWRRATR